MYLEKESVPSSLVPFFDAAVSPSPGSAEDLSPFWEWIEAEHWDHLLGAWWRTDWGAFAFDLGYFSQFRFRDDELRDYYGIEDDEPVNDQARVQFGRLAIQEALENADESLCPTVHCVPLRDQKRKKTAMLGCLMEPQGQAGPVCKWQGVFENEEAFKQYLREAEFVFEGELDAVSDDAILGVWQR